MHTVGVIAAVALGLVFLCSSATKLSDLRRWDQQSRALTVPRAVAWLLPPAELFLAVLLIAQLWRRGAAWLGVALLVAFTAFLVSMIRRGRRPPCACFGSFSARPIGWSHVARNAAFIAVGLVAALA